MKSSNQNCSRFLKPRQWKQSSDFSQKRKCEKAVPMWSLSPESRLLRGLQMQRLLCGSDLLQLHFQPHRPGAQSSGNFRIPSVNMPGTQVRRDPLLHDRLEDVLLAMSKQTYRTSARIYPNESCRMPLDCGTNDERYK